MKCVILQPSYVPWRGVFDQVRLADTFVFYDDVQYDKGGWRGRNRIKTAQGTRWLTVPVHVTGSPRIADVPIDWRQDWARKHLTTLAQAYARAPFLGRYLPLVEAHLARRPQRLADLTIELTIALARELGLERTRFLRSSTLGVGGSKTARLVAILGELGATHYVSGPSARAYLDEALLAEAGITVEFMRYEYPEYPQLHPPFDPHVSILDLLFMHGPDAPRFIWGR